MKHCARDKPSSEITPAPPQDLWDKKKQKAKNPKETEGKPKFILTPCQTDFSPPPFTRTSAPACVTWTAPTKPNYQTTPWATPTTKKATLKPPLLPAPWGSFTKGFIVIPPCRSHQLCLPGLLLFPQWNTVRVLQEKHQFHAAGAAVQREVTTPCQKLHDNTLSRLRSPVQVPETLQTTSTQCTTRSPEEVPAQVSTHRTPLYGADMPQPYSVGGKCCHTLVKWIQLKNFTQFQFNQKYLS